MKSCLTCWNTVCATPSTIARIDDVCLAKPERVSGRIREPTYSEDLLASFPLLNDIPKFPAWLLVNDFCEIQTKATGVGLLEWKIEQFDYDGVKI